MIQLELDLKPKKKFPSKTEVFNLIKDGNKEFTRQSFFDWLYMVELKAKDKGYNKGFEDATPKERYQGEFGARSNY